MVTQEHSAYDRLGLAAALAAPVAWGLTGIFIRLLHGLPPMTIVVGRLLVASVALGIVLVLRPGRARLRWSWSSLAMAAYYVLATEAFARAPVVEVTLLVGMAPVLALGIDRLRGRKVPARQLFGVILAVCGLVAFLLPGKTRADPKLGGDLLALGAAYCFRYRLRPPTAPHGGLGQSPRPGVCSRDRVPGGGDRRGGARRDLRIPHIPSIHGA